MSFRLPPEGHKARELAGDIRHVAEVLAPCNVAKLPDFRAAICSARRTVEAGNGAIKRVNIICIRADDERWLVSVGARGGWRKEWNFGNGRN